MHLLVVDATRHVRLIEKAVDAGRPFFNDDRDRALDVIENASCEVIRACLERAKTAGEPVAVLHLLRHGGCDGGNAGPVGHELGSVAQTLHRAGFAAVIASRFPLSWDGARVFAAELYEQLLRELSSLEDAVLACRAKLSRRPGFDWASLQLYAREADGDETHVFNARPYRGLSAFAPEHARFFFGREHEVNERVADLDALVEKQRPRFIVVAGASGTGKSSSGEGPQCPTPPSTLPSPGAFVSHDGEFVYSRGTKPAFAVVASRCKTRSRGRARALCEGLACGGAPGRAGGGPYCGGGG